MIMTEICFGNNLHRRQFFSLVKNYFRHWILCKTIKWKVTFSMGLITSATARIYIKFAFVSIGRTASQNFIATSNNSKSFTFTKNWFVWLEDYKKSDQQCFTVYSFLLGTFLNSITEVQCHLHLLTHLWAS